MNQFANSIFLALTMMYLAPSPMTKEATHKPPLKIRISVLHSVVCMKDKAIPVDITMINEGQSLINFDSRQISIRVGYGALFDTTTRQRRTDGISIQQDQVPTLTAHPEMISLLQNQAYVRSVLLPLPASFFAKPGFYLLLPSITVDAFSNETDPKAGIIFEVRDCD